MKKLLRRVRGAIGMGVTWALAWASVGFVPRWILGMEGDLPFPILFFGLGFIAGVAFSGLLVLTEGRRRLDQMSLPRMASWGAVVGLGMGFLFVRGVSYSLGALIAIPATLAAASALCASGTLALARRAAGRELTASNSDLLEAERDDAEPRKLT